MLYPICIYRKYRRDTSHHIEGYKPSGLQYIVHITHKMNLCETISSKDMKLNATPKYMISQMQQYLSKPSIILA